MAYAAAIAANSSLQRTELACSKLGASEWQTHKLPVNKRACCPDPRPPARQLAGDVANVDDVVPAAVVVAHVREAQLLQHLHHVSAQPAPGPCGGRVPLAVHHLDVAERAEIGR